MLIYIIIMMIDKNQVQSHNVDEYNCIHDRKDASRNEHVLHVLEVVKLIQLWEYFLVRCYDVE